MYRFEIDPADIRKITEMLPNWEREWAEAMAKIVDLSLNKVRSNAPRKTGKVADSFGGELKVLPGIVEGWIYSDWFVARLQNYGFKEHWYKFPDGPFAFIPGKPRREDGYFVEPSIEEILRELDYMIDGVVNRI